MYQSTTGCRQVNVPNATHFRTMERSFASCCVFILYAINPIPAILQIVEMRWVLPATQITGRKTW